MLNEKVRELSQLKGESSHLVAALQAEREAREELARQGEENTNMNTETVKKLAMLVRDKDLEIEGLAQRNKSLLEIIDNEKEKEDISTKHDAEKDILVREIARLRENTGKVKTDVENTNELLQLKGKIAELEKRLCRGEEEVPRSQEQVRGVSGGYRGCHGNHNNILFKAWQVQQESGGGIL